MPHRNKSCMRQYRHKHKNGASLQPKLTEFESCLKTNRRHSWAGRAWAQVGPHSHSKVSPQLAQLIRTNSEGDTVITWPVAEHDAAASAPASADDAATSPMQTMAHIANADDGSVEEKMAAHYYAGAG